MAEFNADIRLRLLTEGVDRKLREVERKIGNALEGGKEGKANKLLLKRSAILEREVKVKERSRQINLQQLNDYSKMSRFMRQMEDNQKRINAAKEREAKINKRNLDLTAAQAKRERSKRRDNILLGGGFPLLFGAGPGQAIAGAVGGAVGGFGGGIAAQAGVAAISGLNDAIVETAAVTASTAGSFEFLTENQLYSSDETRRLADELAELGKVEELAALNTRELVRLIGNEGVNNLQALDTEWRELLSNVAELGLAIAAFISKYLEPVIALLNNAVGNINTRNRFESLRGDVAGTDVGKQLEQAIREARQDNGRGSRLGALQTSDMEALLKRFEPLRPITAKVPVTDQDRKDFKPPKNSAADDLERQLAAGEKLARQFRQRVEILNAENDLAENLLRITHQREEAAIRIKETAAASQQAELLAANAELLRLERIKAIEEFTKKTVEDVEKYTQKIDDQVALREREEALVREGLNPQLAEALAKIEQQADKQREILEERIKNLDAAIQQLETDGASAEELEKQRKELERIKGLRGEIDEAEGKAKGNAIAENPGKVEAYVEKLKTEITDVEGMIVSLAQSVQSAMATAIGTAVTSLIDGSQKIEQTLADMFKAIGEAFIKMAAEIIAKQLIMIALQSILNALGASTPTKGSTGVPGLEKNSYYGTGGRYGSFTPPKLAEGGYVTKPTQAMIGEAGEPEYAIPSSKMSSALERYNSGMRGEAVVAGASEHGTEEGAFGSGSGNAPINVNYSGPIMRMDNSDYIKTSELPSIIDQSARAGEARALGRLRSSVGVRRKLGMS